MLLNLHVKNLAIIDEIEVDFTNHLNVLTGETGAGKSIIIGSINIALGGKVSKDMIQKGAEFALVELLFSVEEEKTRKKIEQLGVSFEDDTLLISRKMTQTRTINRINGESVTVAMIKKVADLLIDIHGQNEQQSLLHKAKHLEIVDRYAKEQMQGKEEELAQTYYEYKKLSEELAQNEVPEEERLREISFMQYELEEIENAKLVSGEEEELAQEYRRLSNAADIAQGLSEVYEMTSRESGSVSDKLSESIRVLSRIAEYDDTIAEFLNQLSDIDNLVTDVNRDISAYMDEFDTGTEEFDAIEKRLDFVRGIKAKYGATTEQVLAYAQELREKLQKYQEYDDYRNELRKKIEAEEKKLKTLSKEVSDIRKKCAAVLEKEITEALIDLNFLQVRFAIEVREKETYSANGMDDIEFMISTNPGQDLRPLGSAASGGELSRVMLAVKAVLAEHDEIGTMIFDEIDVGISGRTAQMVAEKMALIGRKHQVICISHLAQIAAMADTQYLIEKENQKEHTNSQIHRLNQEESVQELARILGGAQITDAVLQNAREMKELACRVKEEM
ncbi:MAG: DNA repair protein RecN [Butyribacter sp.]|nr:DNA repair protein RecN [bacterium]MDY3854353.1 DNA repair protein RecN [Butyribacter sp.]